MLSYEEALKRGAEHRKKIDGGVSAMRTSGQHPLIGLIDGSVGRAARSIASIGRDSITLPSLSLPRLPTPVLRLPQAKPLKVATVSLLASSVAYASVYGASVASPAFVEGALTSVGQVVVPERFAAPVKAGLDCARRLSVTDEDGTLIGYYRPNKEQCDTQQPSHRSAPLNDDAIDMLAKIYAIREGDYFGGGSVFGFHLSAPYQIIKTKIAHGVTIGASTPLETVQKNALGQGGGLSWQSKLGSISRLPATASYVAPTKLERDRLVAENMPCVTGESGSGLGGVLSGNFCGVIFGRTQLGTPTWAEACVVVSAANVPVRILGERLNSLAEAELQAKRWAETASLARGCVYELEAEGLLEATEASSAINDIDKMSPPAARPSGFYNPDLMLARNAPGLNLASLGVPENMHDPIVLTINSATQRKAASSASKLIPLYLTQGNSGLCFGGGCEDSRHVDFALFIGEIIDDQIVTRTSFETRFALLDGPKGSEPHRSIGSLGKATVAPMIAMSGVSEECLRPIYGLRDPIPSGFQGSKKCEEHTKSMSEIYAISSNIGIANALKHVSDSDLRRYLTLVGASFDPSASEAQIKRGITVGDSVVISPMNFIESFAAQMNAGQVRRSILDASKTGDLFSLSSIIDLPIAYQISRSWLSAPLESGGTARTLGSRLSAAGCKFSVAKTATSDSVVERQWRDKLIGFYTVCGHRSFVSIGLLGSPDVNTPLGNINTSDLVSLIWPAFEQATN